MLKATEDIGFDWNLFPLSPLIATNAQRRSEK
jgi:hypothetical protein